MRVARLHAVGDLRISEAPVPAPEPGMSLVRVTAVGICGSDLHWWSEAGIGDATLTHPLILGHEAAGVIVEGPRNGERVAIAPAVPCGACRSCRDGYRNLCSHTKFAGHAGQDGVMRDFMTWPSELLRALPDALTDAEGSLLEPLGVKQAVGVLNVRLRFGNGGDQGRVGIPIRLHNPLIESKRHDHRQHADTNLFFSFSHGLFTLNS